MIGALLLALVLQTYITRSRGIYIRWKTITHVKRVEDLVDSPCSRVEILRAACNINGNGLPEGLSYGEGELCDARRRRQVSSE